MKLPTLLGDSYFGNRYMEAVERRQIEGIQILLQGVGFSKGWDHYSWSNNHGVDKESEMHLIQEMIRNSSSETVKAYAKSSACDVFVRTGLHTSRSDPNEHVQVQLGIGTAPYYSTACPAYTCHIEYNNTRKDPYKTTCFSGLHSGSY